MRRFLVLGLICCAAFAAAPALASANSTGPVVRFSTTLGNIDVQLLPQYAPQTVSNFLQYVNNGSYATTFFHRSDASVGIIQGGSYQVTNGQRQAITTGNPIPLEYNLPNQRGTLAMARTSDPNSATSGWYFNTQDNTAELGSANGGGYAVFGRIITPTGLQVMDAVASRPVIDDSVDGPQYQTLPVFNYGGSNPAAAGSVSTSNLIMSPITVLPDESPTVSITFPVSGILLTVGQQIGPTSYHCSEDANGTGVASCTATPLDVSTPGSKTFTVTATDYAGNTTTQSVPYTVYAPPPPKPKPAAPQPPSLLGTLTAARTGKLPIALKCTTAARCAGTVTLTTTAPHHKTVRIAFGRYGIAGHRTGKVTVTLTKAARTTLLKKHTLAILVALKPNGGKTKTVHATLHLGSGRTRS